MASAVLIAVRGTPQNPCKLLFCPVNRRLLILVTTAVSYTHLTLPTTPYV